jgi:hypothetical protein
LIRCQSTGWRQRAAKIALTFKRYVKPVLTLVSGTSIAADVVAIKGHATQRPVA